MAAVIGMAAVAGVRLVFNISITRGYGDDVSNILEEEGIRLGFIIFIQSLKKCCSHFDFRMLLLLIMKPLQICQNTGEFNCLW